MNVKHPGYVLGYTIIVSALFGLLLSVVSALTAYRIGLNREAKLNREVLSALQIVPEEEMKKMGPEEVDQFFQKHIDKRTLNLPDGPASYIVYVAYEEKKPGAEPIGYAIQIGGQGFWAPIHGILALEADMETIRGIAFYSDEETPGLGHEINSDWFRNAFKGKKYRNASGEIQMIFTPQGKPDKADNEVDSITGASETTKAVRKFLAANLATFQKARPLLEQGVNAS